MSALEQLLIRYIIIMYINTRILSKKTTFKLHSVHLIGLNFVHYGVIIFLLFDKFMNVTLINFYIK